MSGLLAAPTGRTAWARNLAAPVRDFLATETGGATVLLGATIAALAWANSPWPDSYESVWTTALSIRLGDRALAMDLRGWVNEGLMTFFFLVVGLEAKRELALGQLRERRQLAIPVSAALGGMLVPALIYLAFNAGGATAHGWGAAMSTDTAFALGVLALVASRGTRVRVRLLTIAVVDDLVALIVIAVVYTTNVNAAALAIAGALLVVLVALRRAPAEWRARAIPFVGAAIWVALHEGGVDPVVTGLVLGLVISAYQPARADLEQVVQLTRSFREQPRPEFARAAQRGVASAISPNERLQYLLHPWTSYVIVPLFALANAGVRIDGPLLERAVRSPVTLGIFFGYVLGKPLGIAAGTVAAVRLLPGHLQRTLSWPTIGALGVVAGIGFTVSLLISSLAFDAQRLDEAKVGVLAAAAVSALGSWAAFRLIRRIPDRVRARQVAGTAEDLVDLAEPVDEERDHIRGSDDALVTLVEYGDYECPYCGQAEDVIRELLASFGGDLRYVWRHLPLNDVHPNAQMAAEAAEAAASQGAFWPMHDRLLDHQEELSPSELRDHAAAIGLDVDRFWDELRRRDHEPRIAEDVESADASGVAGTPSFFINGRRHDGAYDVPTLTRMVRAAANRARLERRAAAAPR
jgi:Na+/H+ antiporter NhaA